MTRLRSALRRHGLDLLILAAAADVALEIVFRGDGREAPELSPWLAAPAVALVVLPLIARRRAPFAAPAGVWLLGAALSFADGRLVVLPVGVYAAGMASAFLLGNLRDATQGRIGLAIAVGGAAIIVLGDPDHAAGDVALIPAMFALAWLAGFALRERDVQARAAEERARHAEAEREAAARLAVAEERARIARELHDVVAHALSVMVLQVGAVRHRLEPSLPEDARALRDVEGAGRTALTEMRRLLGALRREDEDAELAPQPRLADLARLVDDVRGAGLPVDVRVEGDAVPLPSAIDLSAYRIVQEGLTNALRHARASRAEVVIRYGDDDVAIEVRDDGAGGPGTEGAGHGLPGVRERVTIFGGDMTAGRVPEGGFVLSARLPVGGVRA